MPFQSSHHLFQLRASKELEDLNYIDELIKEYLLYRGLTESLLVFDRELKQDKLQQFEGSRIVHQLFSTIQDFNLPAFLEFWKYLEKIIFSKLDRKYFTTGFFSVFIFFFSLIQKFSSYRF